MILPSLLAGAVGSILPSLLGGDSVKYNPNITKAGTGIGGIIGGLGGLYKADRERRGAQSGIDARELEAGRQFSNTPPPEQSHFDMSNPMSRYGMLLNYLPNIASGLGRGAALGTGGTNLLQDLFRDNRGFMQKTGDTISSNLGQLADYFTNTSDNLEHLPASKRDEIRAFRSNYLGDS